MAKRVKPKTQKKPKAKGKARPAAKAKPRRAPAKAAAALFGTDGIRAKAGQGALSPEKLTALGRALGAMLNRKAKAGKRPTVLLGVDPRPSADMVGTALASGLIAESCDVHWPGMMSTPEVAFLAGKGHFSAGISVTASHNPADDNGIKIFGNDGLKLPAAAEKELERAILDGRTTGDSKPRQGRFGWLQLSREKQYEEYIVGEFHKTFATLKRAPLGVVIDAAYGARSVDLQILSQLAHSLAFGSTVPDLRVGASLRAGDESVDNALDLFFLNAASPAHPEAHHRINAGCGSMYPQGCANAVCELKADLGICFDGDGDRCVLIDEKGEVRDGDFMLAVLAADLKARGTLKNNAVVTTTMANLGLEQALDRIGVKLVRTDVGDKYVAEGMDKHRATLGGEQSGHIIIRDRGHKAGDGLYTALRVIEVMLGTGKPLSELCAGLRKFPQTILNIKATRKPPLTGLKALGKAAKDVSKRLGKRGRVNIRYSGTEPLLRIMIEADEQAELDIAAKELATAARKDLR